MSSREISGRMEHITQLTLYLSVLVLILTPKTTFGLFFDNSIGEHKTEQG